jgi:hypothetical protein
VCLHQFQKLPNLIWFGFAFPLLNINQFRQFWMLKNVMASANTCQAKAVASINVTISPNRMFFDPESIFFKSFRLFMAYTPSPPPRSETTPP